MTKRVTIYLNPPLVEALQNTDSTSGRLGQICDRYLGILFRARIADKFSPNERDALRDCCNGTIFGPAQVIDGAVLANFEDSLYEGLADKWKVDAPTTIAKLRALTFPEQVALVEEIEAYWHSVAAAGPDGEEMDE